MKTMLDEHVWQFWGAIYALCGLGAWLAALDLWLAGRRGPARTVGLVAASLTLRCVWLELDVSHSLDGPSKNSWWVRMLNRGSLLLQLSAVSLIVVVWATAGRLPYGGHGLPAAPAVVQASRRRTRRAFAALNGAAYTLSGAMSLFETSAPELYSANLFLLGRLESA